MADDIAVALEATRFAITSDTPEMQALAAVGPSRYPEVEACRAFFRDKQRRESAGLCSNAWDGDPGTAWADEGFWLDTSNIWRLDLGACHPVGRVEVTLSQRQPGPIRRDSTTGRGFAEPIMVEVSVELVTWRRTRAHVYYTRVATGPSYPHAFIAAFDDGPRARYLRIMARGFWAQDIAVRTPTGHYLPGEAWRGNNTRTARAPRAVHSGMVTVPTGVEGQMLAVVCQLGPDVTVDPNTEVVLAWVTHRGRTIPLIEASPMLPSHRWEHYAQVPGNNVVFQLPLVQEMAGDTLGVTVALFAPERVQAGWQTAYTPDIQVLCVPVSFRC